MRSAEMWSSSTATPSERERTASAVRERNPETSALNRAGRSNIATCPVSS